MRPRGEIREVLGQALGALAVQRGPVTCRDLAAVSQVGYAAARHTLCNMVRAGEVVVASYCKPAGSTRWHALYEPARWHALYEPAPADDDVPQPWGGIEALAGVMHAFVAGEPPEPGG